MCPSTKSAFADQATPQTGVYDWYNEIKHKRHLLKYEPCKGRAISAVTPEIINALRIMIKGESNTMHQEIQSTLGITETSVHSILHEHLAVRKLCLCRILKKLANAEKIFSIGAKEKLTKYNHDESRQVYDIGEGDESGMYTYEPEKWSIHPCRSPKMRKIQQKRGGYVAL